VAGEIIGPTGGHSDRANGVAPGIFNSECSASIVDSPDDVRRVIRQHHRSGTDLIKIAPSGGVGSVGDDPKPQLITRRVSALTLSNTEHTPTTNHSD